MKADPKSFWISINSTVSGTVLHGGSSFSALTEPSQLSQLGRSHPPYLLPSQSSLIVLFNLAFNSGPHSLAQTLELEEGLLTVAPIAHSSSSPPTQQIPPNPAGCLCALLFHTLAQCVAPYCVHTANAVKSSFPSSSLACLSQLTCSSSSCTTQPLHPSTLCVCFLCDRMSRIYFNTCARTL